MVDSTDRERLFRYYQVFYDLGRGVYLGILHLISDQALVICS